MSAQQEDIGEEEFDFNQYGEELDEDFEAKAEQEFRSAVEYTAFREAENDVDRRLADPAVIDQCIQLVQENLEEVYQEKLRETEAKYQSTIERLNYKIEDLESQLASLEMTDHRSNIEEIIRSEYEVKFKKLEEDLVMKFKHETQDLISQIETEMEEVLESKGITEERRRELEEEIRQELRFKMAGDHSNCKIHSPLLNQESSVKIVYKQAPTPANNEELEQLRAEVTKLREEQAGVARLKSLWNVRVKKAGEVLKQLDKEKASLHEEKNKIGKGKKELVETGIKSSKDGLKIRTDVVQMQKEMANKAAELDLAFRKMLDPVEDDSARPLSEKIQSTGLKDLSHSPNSVRFNDYQEQEDNPETSDRRFYNNLNQNPFHELQSNQQEKPEPQLKNYTSEAADDLVQKKLWSYRESQKIRMEEMERIDNLDFEIKPDKGNSTVRVSQAVKEEQAKKSIFKSVSNDSQFNYEDRSGHLSSEREFSYEPNSLGGRLGQRINSEQIEKKSETIQTGHSPFLFQVTTPTETRSIFSKSDLMYKPLYANQDFETENSEGDVKTEVFRKKVTGEKVSTFKEQVYQRESKKSSELNKQLERSIEKKKPMLNCIIDANKALGISIWPTNPLDKEPSNIMSLVFESDKPLADDSRTAALLDLHLEVSKKRRQNPERLAVRVARENSKGTPSIDRLVEVWKECLGDQVDLDRVLDAIESMSPEDAGQRVQIELKYWNKFKEKYAEPLKMLKRRESVRSQIYSIALEFKKLQDIEQFNKATAGCYNVLRAVDKSLLKCPKEVTYRGIKVDTLIKLDLFEEEYLHKMQNKIHQKERNRE